MKALMVVGTTSQVGKSMLVTALCRILARQGWRVSPFKGQCLLGNSSASGYITVSGIEIAHAQAMQAWAAGTVPRVEMNPVVLKLRDTQHVEVAFKGKLVGTVSLEDYASRHIEASWQVITSSLQQLTEEFDVVVCEGVGNPVETILHPWNVNDMRIAKHLDACTILMADMDRGGVLPQIVGTLELLSPQERSLIHGIVLNRVALDPSLLQPVVRWLESRTAIPVLGTIPNLKSVMDLDQSLSIITDREPSPSHADTITVAVIRLPRISNFTDFDPLEAESTVVVKYIHPRDSLGHPDAVILPGSKTTIADLLVLQKSGMVEALQSYAAAGGTILGICGGFQMMGKYLFDPEGLEGQDSRYRGIGLLPVKTVISGQKVARQRQLNSVFPETGLPISGYELYYGRTTVTENDQSESAKIKCTQLFDEPGLGVVDQSLSIWGTYLHGLFDNGAWRRSWLNRLRQRRGLKSLPTGIANYREQRETLLDALADRVEGSIDLSILLDRHRGR